MKTAFLRVLKFLLYLWRTVTQMYVCRKCGLCKPNRKFRKHVVKSTLNHKTSYQRLKICQGGIVYDRESDSLLEPSRKSKGK